MTRSLSILLLLLFAGCAVQGQLREPSLIVLETEQAQWLKEAWESLLACARARAQRDLSLASERLSVARERAEMLSSDSRLRESVQILNLRLIISAFEDDALLAKEEALRLISAVALNRWAFVDSDTESSFRDIWILEMNMRFLSRSISPEAAKLGGQVVFRYRRLMLDGKLDQEDPEILIYLDKYGAIRVLAGQLPFRTYGSVVGELIADQAAATRRIEWPSWAILGGFPGGLDGDSHRWQRNEMASAALTNVLMVGVLTGDAEVLRKGLEVRSAVEVATAELRLIAGIASYLLDGQVSEFLRGRIPLFEYLSRGTVAGR